MANAGGSASGVEVLDGGRFSEIIGNRIHNIGRVCTDTANGQAAIYIKQNNVLIEGNVIHDVGRLTPGQNGCSPSNDYYQNHDHGVYHSAGDDITVRNNIIYNVKAGVGDSCVPECPRADEYSKQHDRFQQSVLRQAGRDHHL